VRFGELKRHSPGITQATLTPQGESLKPVIYAMIRWGLAYQKDHLIGDFGMIAFHR
jgi:DNA-binding HxlR family transcriptional regulator